VDEELHLSLLGDLELRRDGAPLHRLRSSKAQALLCYLAVTGRPHLRPALLGLLWGDLPEIRAQNNLSKILTYLRQAVGDHLHISRQTVAFNRESRYWLDVEAFEIQVQGILTRATSMRADIERLEGAVELYRGDFLEGFYVRDAPAFEEWVLVQRARLKELALQALYALVTHYSAQGEAGTAVGIDYATRLLALEPWREETHRQLMRLLATSGQRSAAMAQYETCRRTLKQELGVEPASETADLYYSICDGGTVLEDTSLPPHNLPAPCTHFVGRETDLARIGARLRDPNCRLLTLVGPGGSGKTRLALEAASEALHADSAQFTHGIYFVSLAPLRSAEEIVPCIAQALGFVFHAGSDLRQPLLGYLRRKSALLILDNAEHLLGQHPSGVGSMNSSPSARREDRSIVSDILQAAPNVKILVTSRARLNVHGEHLLLIAGMEVPPVNPTGCRGTASEDLSRYSAVQLFLESAPRVQPDFAPTATELAQIARVCRLVEGMPLGIVLAAPWVRMLPVAEIADEIERGYDFLQAQQSDTPERQRSMRAAFEHSWNLLSERGQAELAALSVFRGGFTREAARQVSGVSLQALAALVDHSLLYRASQERYEMHELIREYATEKLALSSVEEANVRDRHSTYYTAALAKWETDLKGARQQAALSEMDAEIDNVRAAWSWAVERGRVAELEQAAEGLSRYYELRALAPEGEAAFQAAGDKMVELYGLEEMKPGQALPADGLRALARMRMWQGFCGWNWHHTEDAHRALRQSLEILGRPELTGYDTRQERGILSFTLGWLGFDTGREMTKQRLEGSLALFKALDSRWWTGRALILLAILELDLGQYGSARHHFKEGLAAFQATGDPYQTASTLGLNGAVYVWLGQVEQAEPFFRESLALADALGNQPGIAAALEATGLSVRWAGRFEESAALLERSVAIYEELGTRRTTVMQNLARAKMHLGQYKRARALGQAERTRLQELGLSREVAPYLDLMGTVALGEGAYDEARRWLQEGIAVFREFKMVGWLSNAVAVMGYAARGIGRPDEAQTHLAEALRRAQQLESSLPLARALPAIALLLADRGQTERAVELYALASTCPYVANSRWFEDVAGREIKALAATLPPEAITAAQERGRARDLWSAAEELLVDLGESTP